MQFKVFLCKNNYAHCLWYKPGVNAMKINETKYNLSKVSLPCIRFLHVRDVTARCLEDLMSLMNSRDWTRAHGIPASSVLLDTAIHMQTHTRDWVETLLQSSLAVGCARVESIVDVLF